MIPSFLSKYHLKIRELCTEGKIHNTHEENTFIFQRDTTFLALCACEVNNYCIERASCGEEQIFVTSVVH